MTYREIDKKRFADLLHLGAGDDELRRFFIENKIRLIQKSAKVQNLPYGSQARIHMLVYGLPPPTDIVLEEWFSTKLTMLDPVPVEELVGALRKYEESGESLTESQVKRLARSCLVYLFSADSQEELITFLRSTIGGNTSDLHGAREVTGPTNSYKDMDLLSTGLAAAIVALLEGRDPDECLSKLPPSIATFIAGLHMVKDGLTDEAQSIINALEEQPEVQALITQYAAHRANVRVHQDKTIGGLQIISFAEYEDTVSFDFDHDEILGTCTKDSPENSVFVRPIAIRKSDGKFISFNQLPCTR